MSYKDQTGKSVDLVGIDWYKDFRSSMDAIHQLAKNATTKEEMLDVLDKLECEMNSAPVDNLVFDIAWRIQYFKREGFKFYRKKVADAMREKKFLVFVSVKDAQGRNPIYGVIYDLDHFLMDLRRVISDSTPSCCFRKVVN